MRPMIKRRHWKKSLLARKTVTIKPETKHHLRPNFGGQPIFIIDWVDRTRENSPYSMVWQVYSSRVSLCGLPQRWDDPEILLGVAGDRREIVHISELELPSNPADSPIAA